MIDLGNMGPPWSGGADVSLCICLPARRHDRNTAARGAKAASPHAARLGRRPKGGVISAP